jgi:hypothetical protein
LAVWPDQLFYFYAHALESLRARFGNNPTVLDVVVWACEEGFLDIDDEDKVAEFMRLLAQHAQYRH